MSNNLNKCNVTSGLCYGELVIYDEKKLRKIIAACRPDLADIWDYNESWLEAVLSMRESGHDEATLRIDEHHYVIVCQSAG